MRAEWKGGCYQIREVRPDVQLRYPGRRKHSTVEGLVVEAVKWTCGLWGDWRWTRAKESLWWEKWSELVLAGKERHKKGRQVSNSQSDKQHQRGRFDFSSRYPRMELHKVKD